MDEAGLKTEDFLSQKRGYSFWIVHNSMKLSCKPRGASTVVNYPKSEANLCKKPQKNLYIIKRLSVDSNDNDRDNFYYFIFNHSILLFFVTLSLIICYVSLQAIF